MDASESAIYLSDFECFGLSKMMLTVLTALCSQSSWIKLWTQTDNTSLLYCVNDILTVIIYYVLPFQGTITSQSDAL